MFNTAITSMPSASSSMLDNVRKRIVEQTKKTGKFKRSYHEDLESALRFVFQDRVRK